jgi:hypothetical protein
MTSLADVMFILVFASLIYSAGLEQRAREAEAMPVQAAQEEEAAPIVLSPPELFDPSAPPRRDAEQLRRAALTQVMTGLEGRGAVVVRVARDGQLRAMERRLGDETVSTPLALPLVERVPDPDVGLVYLAERQDGMSLCTLLRLHMGTTDLSDSLVIITPDVPFEELSVALARGLQRDTERCLADQRGIAVIVDPRADTAPPVQEGAAP